VVGIDPAPTKGLAIFDGKYRTIPVREARSFLDDLGKEFPDLLVCWDAPLTGPASGVLRGGSPTVSSFSQRPIESFFRKSVGFKTPKGISVLGYSGCSHWALSRFLIGLPRTGPFDRDDLPFTLASEDRSRPSVGRHVVEVHPAVALWLWCKDLRPAEAPWDYKQNPEVRQELWNLVVQNREVARYLASDSATPPSSDDELDARAAYTLGQLWLDESSSVVLLGDIDHGSFLVPRADGLEAAFQRFVNGSPQRRREPTRPRPTGSGSEVDCEQR
jgi:predicted nuclease with RNAse H fold